MHYFQVEDIFAGGRQAEAFARNDFNHTPILGCSFWIYLHSDMSALRESCWAKQFILRMKERTGDVREIVVCTQCLETGARSAHKATLSKTRNYVSHDAGSRANPQQQLLSMKIDVEESGYGPFEDGNSLNAHTYFIAGCADTITGTVYA